MSSMFLDVKEKEILESFYNEVAIMYYFAENKNICELVGFASNPPMICVNYYERGSLSRYLRKEAGWSIHNVFSSCYDIANALSDLHDSGFVHGDVKVYLSEVQLTS
jgi:serine/threonine protein kinase